MLNTSLLYSIGIKVIFVNKGFMFVRLLSYMFPDVSLYGGQSSSVALVFSANVTDELRALFDKTLNDYACFQEDPKIQVPEEPSFGQKVSDGIIASKRKLAY